MQLVGKQIVKADIHSVWLAINDPEILRNTIPGCSRFLETGQDTFSVAVSIGIGPVRGEYEGQVEVRDKQAPNSCRVLFSGSSVRGFIRAVCWVELSELGSDQTELSWDAEAEVGGMLLSAGDRVLTGVADLLLKQFFKRLEAQIAGSATARPDRIFRKIINRLKLMLKRTQVDETSCV